MNKIVYHYSSIEVFKKIVESNKLRFTKIDSLNDTSEYQYGTEILQNRITEFEKINNVSNQLDIDLSKQFFFYKELYSISFTENGDDLAFWNSYYVDKATPISIGFERQDVFDENFIINSCFYGNLYPVMERDRYDWFRYVFDLKNIPNLHKNKEFIHFKFQTAHIKQKVFEIEKELRAVSFLPKDNRTNGIFKRNSKRIEYFDQIFNKGSISEIILGPSEKQDLNYKDVLSFILEKNLKCSVKKSNIPLQL